MVSPSGCGKSTILRLIAGPEESVSESICLVERMLISISSQVQNTARKAKPVHYGALDNPAENAALKLRVIGITPP